MSGSYVHPHVVTLLLSEFPPDYPKAFKMTKVTKLVDPRRAAASPERRAEGELGGEGGSGVEGASGGPRGGWNCSAKQVEPSAEPGDGLSPDGAGRGGGGGGGGATLVREQGNVQHLPSHVRTNTAAFDLRGWTFLEVRLMFI